MSDMYDDLKFYRVRVYLHSKKYIIKHLICEYNIPPMTTEDEIKITTHNNSIDITFEAKEE